MRIALPSAIAVAAFAGLDPAAVATDWGGETMGTRWTVRGVLPDGLDPVAVRGAIVERLDAIVATMSHWSADSLLSAFNRSERGDWTTLPPDFAHVMTRGLAIAAASDGAFDPAIGRLVDCWGFGPVAASTPPTAAAIAAALGASGWRRLTLAGTALRQPGGLSLDLSGIAKGHAVDAVADRLAELDVAHALVEIGGELAGRGVRPDGQPWWVDLETPPGAPIAPLRIALHGLSVATSGDYVRGAHTLDPRTGRPIANGVVSASVVHPSALVADAWATALTVAGTERGIALADAHGIAGRVIAVDEAGAHEHVSAGLAAMLADD